MEADPTPGEFAALIQKARAEDAHAIAKLVATYEPYLRRAIRYRINRDGLQSAFDSSDVCQSVMGVFLIRLLSGDYVVESHEGLCQLLLAITNHKFLMAQRREYASKRDRRKTLRLETYEVTDAKQETPSEIICHSELIKRFRELLTAQELALYELRQQGLSWEEIASQLNGSATVLRQKLSRAARRIALELGFEDE